MKKVLVTGHRGYIGSHLVWMLRHKFGNDLVIHGLDKAPRGSCPGSFGVEKLVTRDFTVLWLQHIEEQKPYDVIFHLAAESNISVFNKNPVESVQSTIDIMKVLEFPHKKFVFASSASVYQKESLYAKTKFLCEGMIEKLSPNYTIFRIHNVAGAIPESGFYEFHQPETHLIPNIVRNDIIEIYGDGNQIRDYIHVEDVCDNFIGVSGIRDLNHDYYDRKTYELGTTKGYSVYDVIQEYQRITGKKVSVQFEKEREGDVKELVAGSTIGVEGTRRPRNLESIIQDTIVSFENAGILKK